MCISFAAVYLQGLGYTNAQLGVVMAVGNLLGAAEGEKPAVFNDRCNLGAIAMTGFAFGMDEA